MEDEWQLNKQPIKTDLSIESVEWVNVGADSKNHNLPEPSRFKIDTLITLLEKFTKVKRKDNLSRINI